MNIGSRTNISIAIFLTLIVLINVFAVTPILKSIKEDSQWLVSEKANLLSLEEKIDNFKKFDEFYADREETLRQVDDLFIDSEVPVDFINFLEKTGYQSSVSIEIAPFSAGKKEKDSWPFLNFQVTVEGPFPSFLTFLEKIENSPYLIEIQSLNINQANDAKNPGSVKAFIAFIVYSD